MLRARAHRRTMWEHLAHVGILGFVFALPVVAAAFAGRALAERTGARWVAVACILVGAAIGAFASWHQIQRSLRDDDARGPQTSTRRTSSR
jgi:fructose-specific phosphotransferase system IIC component